MFHHDWLKIDSKLIDTHIIGIVRGADGWPALSKYVGVVEFANAEDGQLTRRPVKAPPVIVVLPAIGERVPMLVRSDGTKAMIDRRDPRDPCQQGLEGCSSQGPSPVRGAARSAQVTRPSRTE